MQYISLLPECMKQISRGATMCAPDTNDLCVHEPTSYVWNVGPT
jgi:hypothetical protein